VIVQDESKSAEKSVVVAINQILDVSLGDFVSLTHCPYV
jgi:hypothetical protein